MTKTIPLSPRDRIFIEERPEFYIVEYGTDTLFLLPNEIFDGFQFPDHEFRKLDYTQGVVLAYSQFQAQNDYLWSKLLEHPFAWHGKEVEVAVGVYLVYVLKSRVPSKKVGDFFALDVNGQVLEKAIVESYERAKDSRVVSVEASFVMFSRKSLKVLVNDQLNKKLLKLSLRDQEMSRLLKFQDKIDKIAEKLLSKRGCDGGKDNGVSCQKGY